MSEEQEMGESQPRPWRWRRAGVLQALMWAREEVHRRHTVWMVTGSESVGSLLPFVRGWVAHVQFNGGSELAWYEFRHWLRETQGEALEADWYVKHLRGEDHEEAVLVLLDWVAEYVERWGVEPRRLAGISEERIASSYGPLPREWSGRPVSLLELFLWVRQRLCEGHELSPLTGSSTIESLFCFHSGWIMSFDCKGLDDPPWESFFLWLRDTKREMPGEGWHVKYLRDCQGDHRRAVLKFLDFVDEYVSLQAPTKGR